MTQRLRFSCLLRWFLEQSCDFRTIRSAREGSYKWYDLWYDKGRAKFWPCFLQYSSPSRFLVSNWRLRRMAYHVLRWLLLLPDCHWPVLWIAPLILQHDPNVYACKGHGRPNAEENWSSRMRGRLSDLQDRPAPIVPSPCPERHMNSYPRRAGRQRPGKTSSVLALDIL